MSGRVDSFRLREAFLAVVGAIGFAFAYCRWSEVIDRTLTGNRGTLYSTLASIFGALLGFSVSSMAIMVAFVSHPRLTELRESEKYPAVWKIFRDSIIATGLGLMVSLAGLVVDRDSAPIHACLILCMFAVLLTAARFARCVWILGIAAGKIARKPPERSA